MTGAQGQLRTGKVSVEDQTARWYREYSERQGVDRNSLLRNPEVLWQVLLRESAIISAVRLTGADPLSSKVLDVGCGTGASLLTYLQLGFLPGNIYGIDLLEERARAASERLSGCHISAGNASALSFDDGFFDICTESTMFIQIGDEELARAISSEMIRVTRAGGYLILCDWAIAPPFRREYTAVTRARIKRLFGAGAEILREFPGALLPPLGRRVSRYLPFLAPLLQLVPYLAAQRITVLKRRDPE